MSRWIWRIALAAHLTLVVSIGAAAYLGALPVHFPRYPHSDLVAHALLVGLLALFADGALGFRSLFPGRLALVRLGSTIVLVVAAVEEMAQGLSPMRSSDITDFAADVVGIVVFSTAGWILHRFVFARPAVSA